MNTSLPPIFGLAIMCPKISWCTALSLWVNQPERSMFLHRAQGGFSSPGDLSFRIEPDTIAGFLNSRINPPSRKNHDTEFCGEYGNSRHLITDGKIHGWDWETDTDRHGARTFDIVKGTSTIPVRFDPAAMDFCTGYVRRGRDEWPKGWHDATAWECGGFHEPKVIRYFDSQHTTNPKRWDEYLAAAAQCWEQMQPSQVTVKNIFYKDMHAKRLRDLWQRQLNGFRVPPDLKHRGVLWQILENLALSAPSRDPLPAIEKSIHRAARRGRITPTNVRALLTLLAAGTGFQPKPRKALAN
jgi:hypothetical protein